MRFMKKTFFATLFLIFTIEAHAVMVDFTDSTINKGALFLTINNTFYKQINSGGTAYPEICNFKQSPTNTFSYYAGYCAADLGGTICTDFEHTPAVQTTASCFDNKTIKFDPSKNECLANPVKAFHFGAVAGSTSSVPYVAIISPEYNTTVNSPVPSSLCPSLLKNTTGTKKKL